MLKKTLSLTLEAHQDFAGVSSLKDPLFIHSHPFPASY